MSRDSNRTSRVVSYVHFRLPRIVEQYEDYCRDKLPHDEVYLPPEHQPINPEDEDDVIPDQHGKTPLIQAHIFESSDKAIQQLHLALLEPNNVKENPYGKISIYLTYCTVRPLKMIFRICVFAYPGEGIV
ncbi:hypothetical protein ABW19_dt0201150 [Dactylella cylindrospora]|nr:hypothetical protein ABW19_dt0201150 [Dactylella cylindrospora]